MAADLTSRSKRKGLPLRRAPYWLVIGGGLALGWRRLRAGGPGTWVLRTKRGAAYAESALGTADDILPADGRVVLNYTDALRMAQARATAEAEVGVNAASLTLREAIETYACRLTTEGRQRAGVDARVLLKHVPQALLESVIRELSEATLREWIVGLRASGLSVGRIDRVRTMLRAAINAAPALAQPQAAVLRAGLRVPDATPNARRAVLSTEQVQAFVASARAQSPDLGLLVQALAETGHRIDQVRRCVVSDLDAPNRRVFVPVSRKGRGQKPRTHIPCPITTDLADRLQTAAAGRGANEPLLTTVARERRFNSTLGWIEVGRREWRHADHARGVTEAVRCAQLPDGTTAYSLRHSRVVGLLMSGLPVQAVAAQLDTSAAIIAQHYGRWISDAIGEEALRAGLMETAA